MQINHLSRHNVSDNQARLQFPPVSFPRRIPSLGILVLPFNLRMVAVWVHVGYDLDFVGSVSTLGLRSSGSRLLWLALEYM